MKKKEIRDGIKTVYQMLWDLLSLYEETNDFYEISLGGQKLDAEHYVQEKISLIKRSIYTNFLGEKEIKNSLLQIIEETEYCVRSCEIPGVEERWMALNPRLKYFDAVFDIMEESPEQYEQMCKENSPIKPAFYPDQKMVEERKRYFHEIKAKNSGKDQQCSTEKIYQEELLRTLSILFEKTFQDYL